MPRKPRNSPRPNGRPPKTAQAAEAEAIAERTGVSLDEAAVAAKIAPRTLRGHRAKRRAVKGAPDARPPARLPPKPLAPPTPSGGGHGAALPQGGAVSGRPDLLELVRRILDARNGAALAELEEGLVVAARGEAELVAWLVRPVVALSLDVDELDALSRGLDLAVEIVSRAQPGGPQLRALRELTSLGKSVAAVRARRPAALAPDAVDERVRGAMDTCVEHLLRHTREATAKLDRDRAALAADVLGGKLAPVDVVLRVDAMLTGASP